MKNVKTKAMKSSGISAKKKDLKENFRVRLTEQYAWNVLSRLLDDLGEYLTDNERSELLGIIRNRSLDRYLELSEAWGPRSTLHGDIPICKFRVKYLLSNILKKFLFSGSAVSRRETAIKKFFVAEAQCAGFNRYGWKKLAASDDPEIVDMFTYSRSFIKRILGEADRDLMMVGSRHGPGASLGVSLRTDGYHKYSSWPYTVSCLCTWYAKHAVLTDERWHGAIEDSYRSTFGVPKNLILNQQTMFNRIFDVTDYNRVTTVPKNATTDRGIAIEPTMNLYLQLGIDSYIKDRLLAVHVDLHNQEKNQKLAQVGSTEGTLATIDLKAASDTVSLKLIELLFEPDWYKLLTTLRSPNGLVEGKLVKYHKLSSMGNGYTFAIESLIFSSFVYAAYRVLGIDYSKYSFAVYGDDIIVDVRAYNLLYKMLRTAGFKLNTDKSFVFGPFRESCGADYYLGADVRPVFLSEVPKSVTDLFNDHNRLYTYFQRHFYKLRGWSALSYIESLIPERFRYYGPPDPETTDNWLFIGSPPATIPYKDGYFVLKRISTYRVSLRKSSNFLFRKLMVSLRAREPLNKYNRKIRTSKGSAFDIPGNKVCQKTSPLYLSNWGSNDT